MSNPKEEVLDEDEIEWDMSDEDDQPDDEDEGANLPVVAEMDAVELPAAWVNTSAQVDQVRKHRKMFNLKHGLFVNVPMVCKNDKCPLKEVCTIHPSQRPEGERCPIEIAAILDRFEKYCAELNVGEHDYFDQSLIKDLVDIEIKLMRANGLLATSADFIEQVTVGIDEHGNVHTRPELHMATVYEEKLLARKAKILNDLNSTRRLREKNKKANDPSSFAAQLMQKAMRARMNIIQVDADVVDADTYSIDTIEEGGE